MQDKSAPEVLTRWVNKTIDLMNGAQNNVLFSMKRNESPPQREQVDVRDIWVLIVKK